MDKAFALPVVNFINEIYAEHQLEGRKKHPELEEAKEEQKQQTAWELERLHP